MGSVYNHTELEEDASKNAILSKQDRMRNQKENQEAIVICSPERRTTAQMDEEARQKSRIRQSVLISIGASKTLKSALTHLTLRKREKLVWNS